MLGAPWDLVLTVAFLLTGTPGIWTLIVCRSQVAGGPLSDPQRVLHLNHAVMSAAMICMIWVLLSTVAIWAQVALFVLLALALLPALVRTGERAHRADLVGHLTLNAAMVWMLAAMPLLMAGMPTGSGHTGHGGHSGHGAQAAAAQTPGWALVVNAAFVAACVAGLLWWLLRVVSAPGHRLHAAGAGLMAAGMGTMLVLLGA